VSFPPKDPEEVMLEKLSTFWVEQIILPVASKSSIVNEKAFFVWINAMDEMQKAQTDRNKAFFI
jgi:hypothetical protein